MARRTPTVSLSPRSSNSIVYLSANSTEAAAEATSRSSDSNSTTDSPYEAGWTVLPPVDPPDNSLASTNVSGLEPGRPDFIPTSRFMGMRAGYVFQTRSRGTGYYLDQSPGNPWVGDTDEAASNSSVTERGGAAGLEMIEDGHGGIRAVRLSESDSIAPVTTHTATEAPTPSMPVDAAPQQPTLCSAAQQGATEVVLQLLEAGVDDLGAPINVEERGQGGRTAAELARSAGHGGLADIIASAARDKQIAQLLAALSEGGAAYGEFDSVTARLAVLSEEVCGPAAGGGADPSERRLCAICLDVEVDAALTPCFHAAFCAGCARSVVKARQPCPLCRTEVTNVQKLFF